MNNLAMERKLQTGEAFDVSECPRDANGRYILNEHFTAQEIRDGDSDFCDAKTEAWIWSIGVGEDGEIVASTSAEFYQCPGYECLWLR